MHTLISNGLIYCWARIAKLMLLAASQSPRLGKLIVTNQPVREAVSYRGLFTAG